MSSARNTTNYLNTQTGGFDAGNSLPLKSVASINTLTRMKRENRNVWYFLTKGFYSNAKEDTYHLVNTNRSLSRSRSRNASTNKSKVSPKSSAKARKSVKAGQTGTKSRGSSRGHSVVRKESKQPQIVMRESPGKAARSTSAVSLINAGRLSEQNLGALSASNRKWGLREDGGSAGRAKSGLSRAKSSKYFEKELTFTPQINKKSKELDKQKLGNEGFGSSRKEIDRIGLLHLRGKEYSQKRELAALAKQLETTEDDLQCSFKPKINEKYQSRLTSELKVEDRSEAWRRRRDQRVAEQRREQREEQDKRESELVLPLKRPEYKSRRTQGRGETGGQFRSPNKSLTQEEYVDIRLNSMRKSLEKQIANYGSGTALSSGGF